MTPSRHRLTKVARRPIVDEPTHPLTDLEAAYLRHHSALGHSANTNKKYEETFKTFHRFLGAGDHDSRVLTTEMMQRFVGWLRETPTKGQRGSTVRSEVSVHGMMKDFRAFTRWLNEEALLIRRVKPPMPKLPERLFAVLSESDLEKVWNSSYLKGTSIICLRNRAMIGLMLDTGLRRAEVASLTLASLDLDNCLLVVIGKGNKQRRVPFSHNIKLILEAWIAKRGHGPDALFWLTGAGIRTTFRRIELETGIAAFYPHQVRHTAATMMVRNNADPFTLQRILGHADLATTQRYVTQSDHNLRVKHASSSPFDAMMRGRIEAELPAKRKRMTRVS